MGGSGFGDAPCGRTVLDVELGFLAWCHTLASNLEALGLSGGGGKVEVTGKYGR